MLLIGYKLDSAVRLVTFGCNTITDKKQKVYLFHNLEQLENKLALYIILHILYTVHDHKQQIILRLIQVVHSSSLLNNSTSTLLMCSMLTNRIHSSQI